MSGVSIKQGRLLSELLAGIATVDAVNECKVSGLAIDSRETKVGDLFLACRGGTTDGMHYINDAITAGAVAVAFDDGVVENLLNETTVNVPLIGVSDLQQQVGVIASRCFDEPSKKLFVVGVTGTNGKSSCCHFLAQALDLSGRKCGIIGTLGYGLSGELREATHTTPNPVVLHSLLKEMHDAGASDVAMEVSSHALEQARVVAVAFDVALFTNLTRDHLDYHDDIEAYGAAKRKLFEMPGLRYAVINRDDSFGAQLLTSLPTTVIPVAYGLVDSVDSSLLSDGSQAVYGVISQLDSHGIEMQVVSSWGEGVLRNEQLLGEFNARNLLAVVAALLLMEVPLEQALQLAAQLDNAAGRMERLGGEGTQPLIVIDYAHTPDALQNVLQSLRSHCHGELVCLFGCGGDRDRGKRPLMGEIAEQYADAVVITDDNPRSEDAAAIVSEIVSGISDRDNVVVIHDREAAIRSAVTAAGEGDVVLIAGKGHEAYQLVGEQKLPFSDRECVENVLQEVA